MSKPAAFNYSDYTQLKEDYDCLAERYEHAMTIIRQAGLISRIDTDCQHPACSSNCKYLEDIAANTLVMSETLEKLLNYLTEPFDDMREVR